MSIISIGVGPAGFTRARLAGDPPNDILSILQAQTKGIYGSDIDLSPASPDGQFLGILAEVIDDTGQAIEDVYNGRDPNAATGQNLTSTCTLNGVYRNVGSYAFVDVAMTITAGAVVPAGTQVQDEDNGAIYASAVDVTGTDSAQLVTCKALVKGSVSAAGKVTKIVSPTYGLQSVTNPSPSTVVNADETDEQLRIRRGLSTAAPSAGFLDSLHAGLLAVPGIGPLKLWENDTGVYKDIKAGDQALGPHSVALISTGGGASDIGAALYRRIIPGVSTMGTSTVTVSDSLGIPHVYKYTIATAVNYAVKVRYFERAGAGFGAVGGEAAIKAALVAWSLANQLPSNDVYRFHLASVAQQAVIGLDGLPAIVIEDLQLGRSSGSLASSDLSLAWTECGVLLPENIAFEVVTP